MNMYMKFGAGSIFIAIIAVALWFSFGGALTSSFKIDQTLLPEVWQYKGLYSTSDQIAKIQANIKDFQDRVGATAEEKYDLEVTIAQEYMRIGQGKEAYEYLRRAEKIDPVNSITYQTMGVLFDSLSAYGAAEMAFIKGIEAQPHIPQNHFALINFYKKQGNDDTLIDETFIAALEATKRNINILMEYGQWLEDEKLYSDELVVWEEVLARSPNSAVEVKVSQLKNKVK